MAIRQTSVMQRTIISFLTSLSEQVQLMPPASDGYLISHYE